MKFFNKKVFNFSKIPFGLDISDLSVKIAQVERDGDENKVVSFGSAAVPLGSVVDGDIIKPDQVIAAIQQALNKAGPKKIKTKKVICSLPETKAFLRLISIPKMEAEEAQEAIKWEMEANIPLSVDQVYYDWQILTEKIGKNDSKNEVLVVTVSKKVVDQVIEVLESASLEVEGMEIESIAQARSLLSDRGEKKTSLIIDFGDRRTSFFISVGNIPCFTCSIPLSSQSMTSAISKGLNVTMAEAEKIKIDFGIGSPLKNDPIFRATRPFLENLIVEVEKSMDFFLTNLRYSDSIDRIIICGGGANTRGIIPFFSQRLGKEIELGNPWTNISLNNKLPVINREQSIKFSTAIGLAIKGSYLRSR